MQIKEWGSIEWLLLIFNIIALSIAIWFLRRKVLSKLTEIEYRQNQSAKRKKDAANDDEVDSTEDETNDDTIDAEEESDSEDDDEGGSSYEENIHSSAQGGFG